MKMNKFKYYIEMVLNESNQLIINKEQIEAGTKHIEFIKNFLGKTLKLDNIKENTKEVKLTLKDETILSLIFYDYYGYDTKQNKKTITDIFLFKNGEELTTDNSDNTGVTEYLLKSSPFGLTVDGKEIYKKFKESIFIYAVNEKLLPS